MNIERCHIDHSFLSTEQSCDALVQEKLNIILENEVSSSLSFLHLGQKKLHLHEPVVMQEGDLIIEIRSPCVIYGLPKLTVDVSNSYLKLFCWDCEFSMASSSMVLISVFGQIFNYVARPEVKNIYLFGGKMISRVPALVLALVAQQLGSRKNTDAIDLLLEKMPNSLPNRLMVSIADEVMGRGGELMAGVFQHPALGERYRERDDFMEFHCEACTHGANLT